MHKLKKFLTGPGLIVALLLSATTVWSLATISARKVYSAGQVFTAADYNADVNFWITYINQLMVKFPGDSVKTMFGSFDTLTTQTADGQINLKDPIWSLTANDSLKMHKINARRANVDSLGVGATGATGAGIPVGFRVAFTAGIRARENFTSFDTVRIVDSLTVGVTAKTTILAGATTRSIANFRADSVSVGGGAVVGYMLVSTGTSRSFFNHIRSDTIVVGSGPVVGYAVSTSGTQAILAGSTFNIGTASDWQLAGTAYTGTMANLNTLRNGSDADALHDHDVLQASDGDPANAVAVSATGTVAMDKGAGITPEGTVHIYTATAGSVTAPSTADDAVIENSAAVGLSLLAPDANGGAVNFGAPSDNGFAALRGNYGSGTSYVTFDFEGAAKDVFRLTDAGQLTIDADGTMNAGDHNLEIHNGSNCSELDASETSFTNCSSWSGWKENIQPINEAAVLAAFDSLRVRKYNYTLAKLKADTPYPVNATDKDKAKVDSLVNAAHAASHVGFAANWIYPVTKHISPKADTTSYSLDHVVMAMLIKVHDLQRQVDSLKALQ